ncbi:MAG: hypothetical protein LUO93_01880, partial [Methanomicrobiales archaeon]|nr:hypothetical protein [Methanomicrobiales archaeon]
VLHPPARSDQLARDTQPRQPRWDANHLLDLGIRWRPGGSGGLVGAGAGVPGIPDLAPRRRLVAGMDDGGSLRTQVTR